jgi:DNA-binding transcriptional regulator PaaX
VLKFALESLRISKPDRWDGKWRMVFYDVADLQKGTRERLRGYLRAAGFYPLQKSVYLHAYPCEREIEFLKYYLGISSGVRVVIADKIENDAEFRAYFGVS